MVSPAKETIMAIEFLVLRIPRERSFTFFSLISVLPCRVIFLKTESKYFSKLVKMFEMDLSFSV